jgi:Ssp1 endopeptidase immunity protein Rap1a
MRHACLLVALMCLAALPSFGELQKADMDASGNRFLAICGDVPDMVHLTEMGFACVTYVGGLTDGIAMFADKGSVQEMYCSPSGATHGQAVRLLVKYIKDHPDKSQEETRMLMLGALLQAFPCPSAPATPPAKK